MKQTLLLALFSLTSFSAIHAEVTFTLENGVLTITGTGNMHMPNYRENLAPWSAYQADIKEVVIEDGVRNIGAQAFMEYKNITSVTIPNSVTSIDYRAFYGCDALQSITIPNSVTRIEGDAFCLCKNLASVTIGNSVETIEDNAFSGCESLTSVDIPNSVKSIGDRAFRNCAKLAHLTLGKCVETIGRAAFTNCLLPKTLIIPSSVQTIEDDAFFLPKNSTSQLERVIIFVNKNLKIKEYVFEGQDNLSEIMLPGDNMVPSIGDIGDINVHCKLYVPTSLENEYCTFPWNDFQSIEPMLYLTDKVPYTDKNNTGLWGCYTRNFTDTEWQALYLPFSLDYEDWKDDFDIAYINGIRQYDTQGDDFLIDETWMDVIKINKGQTKPNYPYVIRAKNPTGQAYFIGSESVTSADLSIACSTTTDKYTITGTYKNIDGDILDANGYYTLSNGELTQSDENATLKPYRWYMEVEKTKRPYDWNWGNLARSIKINLIEDKENVVNGITELHAPKNTDNSVYDLNGRKMNEDDLKPGLYIKNGKKVVIR
ncbi:MAG: leucine-rich repeat domain-containing protein [Prevotella sp.]|nr:leucine-rich repeat domain-containing protein [Prevotella sp.]